jgi:type IV pilus assembly protein PilA
MTKQIKSKGFTIVELLIVIVVIAILAAITIVAYNGIQQRAHTTSQKTTAENLAKKVEGYNAINNAYPVYNSSTPTVTTLLSNDASTSLTGSGITINGSAQASGVSDGTVELDLCSTSATALASGTAASGYIVYIWDQTKNLRDPVQAGGNVTVNISSGSSANTLTFTGSATVAGCVRAS